MSFRSKVTVAGLIVLAAACNTEAGTPLGPDTITEPVLNANVGGSKSQQADLLLLADLFPEEGEPKETVRGSASLTRLPNGITTHVNVDPGVIPEGDVITVWGVIFDPSECDGACDSPTSVVWLGSGIASGGSTQYTGHIKVGDASGDILDPRGPGLVDPAGAEIHVVVRTHGQPIPGQLQSQRKTFDGGCDVNACEDLLVAPFPAP